MGRNKTKGDYHSIKNSGDENLNVKELIHELQIHKIELEMQNEELRSIQQEMEKSRNKYHSLFEMAPVGFFTLDAQGIVLETNEKAAALVGVPPGRLRGRRFAEFIHVDYLPVFYTFLKGLQKSLPKKISEIQFSLTSKFVQIEGVMLHHSKKNDFAYQLAIIDVTQRKKEEEKYALEKVLQQKKILNTILETQEEERINISEALHNGLGQLLYAAKLKIEDIKGNEKEKEKIQLFLDDAITETRNLSFLLMPTLLKDFGLKIILEETAKRISTNAFTLECIIIGLNKRLPNTLETSVFRIIQELLNNILRHANASCAVISVRKYSKKLIIVVKDNGGGFDVGQSEFIVKGTGLKSVYSRLELLNGTMEIQSEKGRGTTVTVEI
jgi:PAS domain S-box-containing protein